MNKSNRRNFSPEFKLEPAQLVLDQHYTVAAAATAMNVGKSTMDKWVRQLKEESAGKNHLISPYALARVYGAHDKKAQGKNPALNDKRYQR